MSTPISNNDPKFPKRMYHGDFFKQYIQPSLKFEHWDRTTEQDTFGRTVFVSTSTKSYISCGAMQNSLIDSGWNSNAAKIFAREMDVADGKDDGKYTPSSDSLYTQPSDSNDTAKVEKATKATLEARGALIVGKVVDSPPHASDRRWDVGGVELRITDKPERLPDGGIVGAGAVDVVLSRQQMKAVYKAD